MSLLTLEGLQKHYGNQSVLRGASLVLDAGAKIGLVGRNGGGKSTLLRIATGEEAPDWGRVNLRKNASLAYVPQRPNFEAGVKVKQWVESGLDEVRRLIEEQEQVAHRMAEAGEGEELTRLMTRHDRLTTRIEELGGWEVERNAEVVMSGIGLAPELWEREARTLSGGEQSRTALAHALVGGHDLLLLDEPTNHLDLEGIEWIEAYLKELETAVLVVSHDRRLLSNAVDAIVELERGELVRYPGNWPRYLQVKAERYESESRAYEQQQDKLRKEDAFIKRHMGTQRTAEAKGRLKRMQNTERLEQPHHDVRRPNIRAPKAARGGELVMTAMGLAGGYGDKRLFEKVELRIGRGQRIGIVGHNGSGKSTLLRILAGRMAPLAGEVVPGHGSICAFYDQDTSSLRDDSTPFLEIRRDRAAFSDLEVRSYLARFLFRGEEVDKEVSALSGGERARLSLARLLLSEPSWMALDEPTNHLDLAGRTALEEMLGEFDGALVCVSHDREFLDGLCNFIFEVGHGSVRVFEGNYSNWRRCIAAEREAALAAREAKARAAPKAPPKKSAARASDGNSAGKGRVKNPWAFERLEKKIIKLEERLSELNVAVGSESVFRDPDKLRETQFEIAEVEDDLARANEEWEAWETG